MNLRTNSIKVKTTLSQNNLSSSIAFASPPYSNEEESKVTLLYHIRNPHPEIRVTLF